MLFALVGGRAEAQLRRQERPLAQWQKDLERKRSIFSYAKHFEVLDKPTLRSEEREALTFLYAYMPANDLVDYSGEYYLRQVQEALKARQEMPWGKRIPEREWRHFVLPPRVNNEALDTARLVFYPALKERVRHLSLYEAVLEVNHWCHERVVYKPSDARTSSPLATVRTAYGRCGEESTLLVAALRSVGIPARQVYTPRWAHTDDNHAWVEAWVDGRWLFLGACEPEPVLNLGWFNAPVSRAMLVHTKVFGKYDGPEEVMSQTPTYTEINVINNYAQASPIAVEVVDHRGRKLAGVTVEFKVYNYGEFYSVARRQTDRQGIATLTAGQGDMLVYAASGSGQDLRYGFRQISFGKDKRIRLKLERKVSDPLEATFTIVPPREAARYPEVSEAYRQRNNLRLAQEDSIRNVYVSTFLDKQLEGLDARGNWQTLRSFVERNDREQALALLSVISAKDLRDVELETLEDHLKHSQVAEAYTGASALVMPYVYNPRVAHEAIQPYKALFRKELPQDMQATFRANPEKLAAWCRNNIQRVDADNPLSFPISPVGVWRSRRADIRSLGVFFVAVARSLGVPARIDGVTGKVQYYRPEGAWQDVSLESKASTQVLSDRSGTLQLSYTSNGIVPDPKYYHHFTLSRFDDKARLRLLNYDEGDNGLEEGTSWSKTFRPGVKLDAGHYLMVSGSRLSSGNVLVQMKSLGIEAGKTTQGKLMMPRDSSAIAVLGNFNSENLYTHIGKASDIKDSESLAQVKGEERSLLSTTGRGYYVLGILGAGEEPTNHALRDIIAERETFDSWGQSLVLLFADKDSQGRYRPEDWQGLPKTTFLGVDTHGQIAQELRKALRLSSGRLPIFVVADTFNRVVFVSEGYTIGLGRQIGRIIKGLQEEQKAPVRNACTLM